MKSLIREILLFMLVGELLPDTAISLSGVIWEDDTYRNIGACITVVGTFPLLITGLRSYQRLRLYHTLSAILIGMGIGIMLI